MHTCLFSLILSVWFYYAFVRFFCIPFRPVPFYFLQILVVLFRQQINNFQFILLLTPIYALRHTEFATNSHIILRPFYV